MFSVQALQWQAKRRIERTDMSLSAVEKMYDSTPNMNEKIAVKFLIYLYEIYK